MKKIILGILLFQFFSLVHGAVIRPTPYQCFNQFMQATYKVSKTGRITNVPGVVAFGEKTPPVQEKINPFLVMALGGKNPVVDNIEHHAVQCHCTGKYIYSQYAYLYNGKCQD